MVALSDKDDGLSKEIWIPNYSQKDVDFFYKKIKNYILLPIFNLFIWTLNKI